MTLQITCLRHGESAANVGEKASGNPDPSLIPLTTRGQEQAARLAQNIPLVPDKIITSPFLRARQTAQPTAARFGLELEIEPVEELTSLAPARCRNTNWVDRQPWVEAFWQKADPFYVDGEGAESFAAFMGRVDAALEKCTRFKESNGTSLLIFSHGLFLQALRWRLAFPLETVDGAMMNTLRNVSRGNPIGNTDGFSFCL